VSGQKVDDDGSVGEDVLAATVDPPHNFVVYSVVVDIATVSVDCHVSKTSTIVAKERVAFKEDGTLDFDGLRRFEYKG